MNEQSLIVGTCQRPVQNQLEPWAYCPASRSSMNSSVSYLVPHLTDLPSCIFFVGDEDSSCPLHLLINSPEEELSHDSKGRAQTLSESRDFFLLKQQIKIFVQNKQTNKQCKNHSQTGKQHSLALEHSVRLFHSHISRLFGAEPHRKMLEPGSHGSDGSFKNVCSSCGSCFAKHRARHDLKQLNN